MSEKAYALDERIDVLTRKAGEKTRNWVDVYELLNEIEKKRMWAPRYSSMTECIGELASRLGCSRQYLWRVKKAGRFYEQYKDYCKTMHEPEPMEMRDLPVGDEILADLDRLSAGDMERASRYMQQVLDRQLTKSQIKGMVRAAAAVKRGVSRGEVGYHREWALSESTAERRGTGNDVATPKVDEMDAFQRSQLVADMVAGLTIETFFNQDGQNSRNNQSLFPFVLWHRGPERRIFQVIPDFPFDELTHSENPPASAYLLVVTNIDCDYPQDVHMYAVDIRTTHEELRCMDSAKSSAIDSFVDGHCIAVPQELEQEARARLPQGWGMLVWPKIQKERKYKVGKQMWAQREIRYDESRARILSMALLRLAQQVGWNR